MNFDKTYAQYKDLFETYLQKYVQEFERNLTPYYADQLHKLSFLKQKTTFDDSHSFNYARKIKLFYSSLTYSLLGEGKRFRPVIVLATADMCGLEVQRVLPYALAVEMIHTYSLIHDDLPCMDNDEIRRGKPTNHKVHGESTSLLAGDALLTEAFGLVMQSVGSPENKIKALQLLVECAGFKGMVGGQYFDIETQKGKVCLEELAQMQMNKTGALISASMMGAAIFSDANPDQKAEVEKYATLLGLSFQIADDILDKDKNELGSFVSILGLEESKTLLKDLTENMFRTFKNFEHTEFFGDLAKYNAQRLV